MQLSWDDIQSNAITFAKKWRDAKNEEADAQGFEADFLRVFGVADARSVGSFEHKVPLSGGKMGYFDYLWPGKLAIEMKSRGKDLDAAFLQLQNYIQHLPPEEMPDLWMVCDFENIRLNRRSTNEVWSFKTRNLRRNIKRFAAIAGYETERVWESQAAVNVKAAEKMAKLHDALRDIGYDGHALEVYLVRLLFCLFADDTGIFPENSFLKYIEDSRPDGSDLSERIARLFELLDMPEETRAKRTLLADELKRFRYINGGLFRAALPFAEFSEKMRQTLLDCVGFDWGQISPAIFGAMFQGVMDKDQRREMGAHYTSEENILKLINPLFLDALWQEFDRVKTDPAALERFHEKIAGLKFLDPACGCGNFLIITYRELRQLEFEILKMKRSEMSYAQMRLDENLLEKDILVNVNQFYGIEYEDFPCQIAQVGMWLVDHQMNNLAADYFGIPFVRLPLRDSATIVNGNALRMDWEGVVPKNELSYILGNPPFVGYSNQTAEQKADMMAVWVDANGKPFKAAGKIDYVAAWYYKAAQMMRGTRLRAAFVSTNSITQGEQAAAVWQPLYVLFGIHIDFGCRTFKWSNEAKGKAAVHCVIVGFSTAHQGEKMIYDGAQEAAAQNINPYLVDAPDIFVESRKKPLCDVPEMMTGNRPADGGHLIIEEDDLKEFLEADPLSEKYIRRFMGSAEFINNKKRWCLWLVSASPAELRKMPEVMKRVAACEQDRANAPDAGRRKLAETPTLFREQIETGDTFIVVPAVSSERRRYIPIGFLPTSTIASNLVLIIPNATLYHFGILTSNVHMVWMRAVCGRLEMRYRYSKDVVYNNFPWPEATPEQKAAIEALAQGVLDARAQFPGSSLADLYDPLTMPPALKKAHESLDRAVMKLYGFTPQNTPSEAACVAKLMERCREMQG